MYASELIRCRSPFFGFVSSASSSSDGSSTLGGTIFSPVNSRKLPHEPQNASES
jgi:hypothetical protein